MEETDIVLKEMEEDLRREKLRLLWKRFGNAIIGISAGVIVITFGSVLWQNYRESEQQEQTGRFLDAAQLAEQGKSGEAAKAFGALAKDASGDMATLALLRQGQALMRAGKPAEASAAFKAAHEEVNDETLQGVVDIWLLTIPGEKVNIAALAEQADDNAFADSLHERLALAAIHDSHTEQARTQLQAILNNPAAPASLKVRAAQWLSLLPPQPKK